MPALIAGLITVAAAVLLATAPATNATHQPEALPAAPTRRALPAPAPPVHQRSADRIIWWGAPPIWRPPARMSAALTASPVHELNWNRPLTQPLWTEPQPPDADQDELPEPALAVSGRPTWQPPPAGPAEPVPARQQPAPLRPWHDL